MPKGIFKFIVTFAMMVFGVALSPTVQAAPPAIAFGELPVSFDADISPDGNRLAILMNVDGTYMVYTTSIGSTGSDEDVVSLGEDIQPEYVRWLNNDRYVVSLSQLQSYGDTPYMMGFLFTKDLTNGKKGRHLLKTGAIFRQNNNVVVDWLGDDPDHILMAFEKETFGEYPGVYKVNVDTGRFKRVLSSRTGIQSWEADDNGVPRIGRGTLNNGKEKMIIFDPATDKWDSYEEYPGLDFNTPRFGFIKKGSELIIGDYNGRDTLGLYVLSLIHI